MRFRTFKLLAAAFLLASAAPAIAQQPYPNRLIKIVVPVSVGAGADLIARVLAPRMSERMGVPVIVENLPAGGGYIGIASTARTPADGYTLLMAPTSYALQPVLNKNAGYDPLGSYASIGLVATGSMVLAVSQNTSAKTLKDFLALAKAAPGTLTYGSPGNGTPQHLAMELFKLDGSIDLLHVPYKEASGAVKDLAAGQINAAILTASSAAPLANSGRVLVLGNLGDAKSGLFSAAPLLTQEGFPSMGVGVWVALMMPANAPAEVVRKLNGEMNAILEQQEAKDAISKLGLVPQGGTPERLTSLVKSDVDRWTRAVVAAKIKMD
jgi:tripartite-type tricarboxylate transporter receptor subunit TctC